MKDLIKLSDEIVEEIPDLQSYFTGIAAVYAEVTLAYRMRKGLTQSQLAQSANISPKTVHRVESGNDNGVTTKTYESIFNVLGVNHNDVGDAFKKKPTKDLVTNP